MISGKNIIIAGPSRAGKSTLAAKINRELNYRVISVDKMAAIFHRAYPQLDIRLNWNREKTTENLAPFLGHCLGFLSKENGFVLEGGYFDFDIISPILKMYGVEEMKDTFSLIGLVQNNKTVDEFISDFKVHDTEDDWTYHLDDEELRKVAEDAISFSKSMSDHLAKHGFTIHDTSKLREQVLDRIIEDIKAGTL